MRRIFYLFLILCLLVSLAACGAPVPPAPAAMPGRWVEEELNVPLPKGAFNFSLQAHGGTLHAVFYDGANKISGYSRSDDKGKTWTPVPLPFTCGLEALFNRSGYFYSDLKLGADGQAWFVLRGKISEEADLSLFGAGEALCGLSDGSSLLFGRWKGEGADPVLLPVSSFYGGSLSAKNGFDFLPVENGECLLAAMGENGVADFVAVDAAGKPVDSFTVDTPSALSQYFLGVSEQKGFFQVVNGPALLMDFQTNACSYISTSFSHAVCYGMMPDGGLYGISNQSLEYIAPDGSLSEELLSGKDYFFGGEQNFFNMLVPMQDDVFVVMNNSRLFRYYYDPNALPVSKTEAITVFSMHDDGLVRQTIAQLELEHPSLTVAYRIGDSELEGAMTEDDLIKSLNTELLAGAGPDVLILDDMSPLRSYLESGVFMDLSETAGPAFVFPNLLKTGLYGDKLYAVPGSIFFPTVLSQDRDVMAALDGVAPETLGDPAQADRFPAYSTLKELLQQSAAQAERGVYQQLETDGVFSNYKIHLLSPFLSANSFESFYTAALPDLSDPAAAPQAVREFLNAISWMRSSPPSGACTELLTPVLTGTLTRLSNWRQLGPLPSLSGKMAFLPRTVAAVPQKTANPELALDFIRVMLSEPVQRGSLMLSDDPSSNFWRLLGLRRVPSAVFLPVEAQGELYGALSKAARIPVLQSCLTKDAYGLYGADAQAFSKLCTMVESLDAPVFPDAEMARRFYDVVLAYLNGALTLDEAADEILTFYEEATLSALEMEK